MTVGEINTRMGSRELSGWQRRYERLHREEMAARNRAQVMGK